MTRWHVGICCLVVFALAATTGYAQVKGGCPAGAPDTNETYTRTGTPFILENEGGGAFERLATVEYFTTGGMVGVCLIGTNAEEWWVATSASPQERGFSLATAGTGQASWDELVIRNADNTFTTINSLIVAPVGNQPLAATNLPTAGGIGCMEIQGGSGGNFKSLVWENAASSTGFRRQGGLTQSVGPGCPGTGTPLALPGAPVYAEGPAVAAPEFLLAAFFPPVYATFVVQNVERTVQVTSVPLLSDWMLAIFVMLVLLLASWMITRRGRRQSADGPA